jgi:hypothetical protein
LSFLELEIGIINGSMLGFAAMNSCTRLLDATLELKQSKQNGSPHNLCLGIAQYGHHLPLEILEHGASKVWPHVHCHGTFFSLHIGIRSGLVFGLASKNSFA